MTPIVSAQGLTFRDGGTEVVDHLQFHVPEGARYAIVGRRGAGKTATLRMLASILDPTNGTALVSGYDVKEEPREVRTKIGYVDQSSRPVRRDWRPWPYLRYWGRLQGMSARGVRAEAEGLMARLVDGDLQDTSLTDLPTVQRRRLGVVRALLHDPDVLLLDDPTFGWDLVEKQSLWEDLDVLLDDRDTTLVVGTQDGEEVEALATHAAVLSGTTLAYEGAVEDIPGEGPVRERLVEILRRGEGGSS